MKIKLNKERYEINLHVDFYEFDKDLEEIEYIEGSVEFDTCNSKFNKMLQNHFKYDNLFLNLYTKYHDDILIELLKDYTEKLAELKLESQITTYEMDKYAGYI